MNVQLVDMRQIQLEFNQDTLTPSESIRAFISYALQYWTNPKPKYLLLAGDAQFIPSVRVRSIFADNPEFKEDSVSIDEWYAVNSYESDTKPDIAIGRFPVRTIAQLNVMTAKTRQFEDSLDRHSYANDMLFITDRTDAGMFESLVNDFIGKVLPPFYRRNVIRFGDTTFNGGTRKKLFEAINSSTLFFSAYIHGNPNQWSKYRYFTSADVDSLAVNHHPFILTCCACAQNFDVPSDSVIVERLLTMPNGGAVATLASTGLAYSVEEELFLEELYKTAFGGTFDRIGDIILASKRGDPWYVDAAMQLDFSARRFTLLGDPALKMPRDIVTDVRRQDVQTPAAWALDQNFPNPFNPSTTISFRLPFRSFVTLKIYDMMGRDVATVISEEMPAGNYSRQWEASTFPSGMYFYRLQAGAYTETKRMILLR